MKEKKHELSSVFVFLVASKVNLFSRTGFFFLAFWEHDLTCRIWNFHVVSSDRLVNLETEIRLAYLNKEKVQLYRISRIYILIGEEEFTSQQ